MWIEHIIYSIIEDGCDIYTLFLKFTKMTLLLLDFIYLARHIVSSISPSGNITKTNRLLETIFRL